MEQAWKKMGSVKETSIASYLPYWTWQLYTVLYLCYEISWLRLSSPIEQPEVQHGEKNLPLPLFRKPASNYTRYGKATVHSALGMGCPLLKF